MQKTLEPKELQLGVLAAESYHLTSERHKDPSDNDYEQGTKRSELLIEMMGFAFKGVGMTRAMITNSNPDSIVVALVHLVLSLNLRGSTHH